MDTGTSQLLAVDRRPNVASTRLKLIQLCGMAAFALTICLAFPTARAQAQMHWPPAQNDLNTLVQRFRPYLKFSTGSRQESRPVTWQYLYANSTLMNGSTVVVPLGGLAGSGASQALNCSNLTKGDPNSPTGLSCRLKIDETHNAQYGEPWPQAEAGDGLYARATYLANVTTQVPAVNLVNIEYWVLLGFNVGPSV